ncbi:TPA: type 1 fimbrial protein [Klebsiella aerogenes]|nr:type 1 fimbrial protein [Klebsiella aerogenes]
MKTVLNLASAITLFSALLISPMAEAGQAVTVSFTGELLPGTCDATVNGTGPDATVTLPKMTTGELNSTGIGGKTAFTIALTNCFGTLDNGGAFFESTTGVNSRGYITNSEGTAKSVDFLLYASDGTTMIKPGDAAMQGPYLDITSGSATQTFYVAYVTDGKNATGGTVSGKVIYRLDYK